MRYTILALILVPVQICMGQSFFPLSTKVLADGDSVYYSGQISRDLVGNGMLKLEILATDSLQVDSSLFQGFFWGKFMDGSLLMLRREETLAPTKTSLNNGSFSRIYSFPLSQLEQKKMKEIPIKYFFQRELSKGKIKGDTIWINDPWIFIKPSVRGEKYWKFRN